ncbi:glycosyltransferase family 2 protein [Shimia sp.]|uniref:glycosyltransferase family 2 protein n=1 Tax=Shimia sp. TaxID=1954381 RepID=UPI003565C457
MAQVANSGSETQVGATGAPRVTVVTTMKDEGAYILDWVAHYKTIGASEIVVFTNDVSDPTDHILRRLNCMGEVQHRFSRVMRRGPHKSALMWAEHEPAVRQADWLLVVDVDEYLDIRLGDGSLGALIAAHPGADAISFPWRIFGNAGVEAISGAPVPVEFTRAQPVAGAPDENRFFKTLFRNDPEKFARMGVHRPFLAKGHEPVRWVLPDGRAFSDEEVEKALFVYETYGYEAAQLNHYALRSLDGFLNKKQRGRANHQFDQIEMSYWNRFDKNDVEDRRLAENFEAAQAYRDRLLASDKILREHHELALAWARKMARKARRSGQFDSFLATVSKTSESAEAAETPPA